MRTQKPLILGIESSCDETALALLRGEREVIGSIIASQVDLHREFGGVVPEIACRAHMDALLPSLAKLMQESRVMPEEIDAIAVTNRPGLIGALLLGVSAAKGLALAWDKPLIGVNHIEAHITAAHITEPELTYPFVALIVSGGHTTLYLVSAVGSYKEIARTRDDAAGEAFDKAASVLGLSYPGGPSIEKVAVGGDEKAYSWKKSCSTGEHGDFSFSGIKTAVLYAARGQNANRKSPMILDKKGISDVAASFQQAVVHALVTRTLSAADRCGVEWIALGGGVAANTLLRKTLEGEAARNGFRTAIARMELCTDNAVMVAARGYELFTAGVRDGLDLAAHPRAPLAV